MDIHPLMSREEVMQYLGISSGMLWKLTTHPELKKRIPTYYVGRRPRFKFEDLQTWLENRKT